MPPSNKVLDDIIKEANELEEEGHDVSVHLVESPQSVIRAVLSIDRRHREETRADIGS